MKIRKKKLGNSELCLYFPCNFFSASIHRAASLLYVMVPQGKEILKLVTIKIIVLH